MEDKKVRQSLYDICLSGLMQKISEAELAMKDVQASANLEEKSSMGDKYETGRAMGHLEAGRIAMQIKNLREEQARLLATEIQNTYYQVQEGALVRTTSYTYFISAAIGAIMFNNTKYMVVSRQSPIAKALWTKKAGDTFIWNGKKEEILSVI